MARYDQPQQAKDDWTKQIYKKYGLPESPTMEQIRPIALNLLGNVHTTLEGAQLILGRTVDAGSEEDKTICQIALFVGNQNPEKAFEMILLQRGIEDFGS